MPSLRLLLFATLLTLPACMFVPEEAQHLRHSASRSASVATDGAEQVRVDAGAGDLEVVGRADLTEVQAHGTARTSREEDLDRVRLEAQRSGDEVRVTAQFPEDTRGRMQLDVTVEVPRSLAANVDDSSGDLTIRGIEGPRLDLDDSSGDAIVQVDGPEAFIDDSSGELEVRGAGATEISDSSGDIELFDLGGRLTLDDSSGEVRAEGVGGAVEIPDDSSGDIRIRDVVGHVRIMEDSSGDIVLRDVGGNVRIGEDSSGDIVVRGSEGDFTVEEDSSGDIRYEEVAGSVSIPDDD